MGLVDQGGRREEEGGSTFVREERLLVGLWIVSVARRDIRTTDADLSLRFIAHLTLGDDERGVREGERGQSWHHTMVRGSTINSFTPGRGLPTHPNRRYCQDPGVEQVTMGEVSVRP
jgi:hypothetical protein